MTLAPKLKQELKAKAHKLKPVVLLGNNGLSANVLQEIERALHDHELIKVRIQATDRDEKLEIYTAMCATTRAEAVQLIGNVAILYRKRED